MTDVESINERAPRDSMSVCDRIGWWVFFNITCRDAGKKRRAIRRARKPRAGK